MDLSSKALFMHGQHAVQAILSLYGLAVSYTAITKLQKYEKISEKAAEWSSEAARQLHQTRTTQASGAVAILASLASSLTLTFASSLLPRWARLTISPAMLLGVVLARTHIKNYWVTSSDGKTVGTRVPLPNMGDYNDAQRTTQDLLKLMEYLEYSWVATSFVNGMLVY